MIPVRLEFAAFGPFPDKQVIDFTRFDDDRLFLITGPTGSGKTTIFDALTYSLYGEASGSLREKTMLKSDFIGENGFCYTSFTFLVHEKQYTVRRIPQQRCPRQRGEGFKEQMADAELSDEDGVVCTHVGPVNRKIEELIGLNSEQFHKIVLLPQGEFRRFLSDKSDAKQEILRHIFSTGVLSAFTERLKQNVSIRAAAYQDALSQCAAFLHTIQAEADGTLAELLATDAPNFLAVLAALSTQNQSDETTLSRTAEQLHEAAAAYDCINLDLAKTENDLLAQRRKAAEEFAEMERHNAEWAKRRETLALLEKAAPAAQKEQECRELSDEIARLNQSHEMAEKTRALQNERFLSAQAEQTTAKAAVDAALKDSEQIPALKAQLQKYAELSAKQSECAVLSEQLKKYEQARKALADAKLWFAAKEALSEAQIKKQARERFFETLRGYQAACTEAAASAKKSAAALSAYIAAQAPFLAAKLRENEPCPVCGSTVHPAPAQPGELSGSKAQYEQARLQETKAVRRRDQLLQELSHLLSEENREKDPLSCIELERENHRLLCAELEIRQNTVSAFRIPEKLKRYSPEELNTRLETCVQQHQQIQGRLSAVTEQYEALAASLPGNINEQVLSDRIVSLERQAMLAQKCLQEAAAALEEARVALARTQEQIGIFAKQITEKMILLQEKQSDFSRLMEGSGLTEETYRALLPILPELAGRRETLQQYKIEYRGKRDTLQRLKEQTASLKEHDLDDMAARKQDAQEKRDALQEQYNRQAQRLRANKSAADSLLSCTRTEEKLRAALEQARFLYEVARGDFSGKVNFERYVLAYYFENVIQTANLRLEQMTNSRYTLVRRTQSKGNRTAGLDLDVFDAYTGTSRNVDTLSGGESFKVALSLALGLADIISENSGGIELNTMLIDEGFGSLDSDSLDAAVSCLYDLRAEGRYIGIISHVSELKERIPQQIHVAPGVNGSTIREGSA